MARTVTVLDMLINQVYFYTIKRDELHTPLPLRILPSTHSEFSSFMFPVGRDSNTTF